MKKYSFIKECGMCAAGLATSGSYESPAAPFGIEKKSKRLMPKKHIKTNNPFKQKTGRA